MSAASKNASARSRVRGLKREADPYPSDMRRRGPNVHPQVLGFEAVIWEPKKGEIQALPSFPGDLDTIASAINDKGQAVDGSGTCTTAFHAVLWQNGAVTDLGKPGRCDGQRGLLYQ
jgi:probable HAF family extracellular repeat protein